MSTIRTYDGQFLIAKQSAKGATATTDFHKFRRTDGRIQVTKDVQSVQYIDGDAWSGSDFDFTKSISGQGSITIQVTPEGAARLAAWALGGVDAVSGSGDPYEHDITPGDGLTYLTVVDSLGKDGDLIDARIWTDCVITQVEITSTHDAGVVTAKLDLLAASHTISTDLPNASSADSEPLLHTQAHGNINVADLNAVAEIEAFTLTIDTNAELLYGDSVSAYAAHRKRGQISWSATVACTSETIKVLYSHLYGTNAPADGAIPSAAIFKAGFNPTFIQNSDRVLSVSIPNNRVIVDTLPDPNAAGDHTTLAIAGVARNPGMGNLIEVSALTGEGDAY